MNPTNLTQPEFGPWGPNPTQNWVQIGYIKYITGLNPNLNPIWGQLDPIGPIFLPWGPTRPNLTQILGLELSSTQKNRSGLAALVYSMFQTDAT